MDVFYQMGHELGQSGAYSGNCNIAQRQPQAATRKPAPPTEDSATSGCCDINLIVLRGVVTLTTLGVSGGSLHTICQVWGCSIGGPALCTPRVPLEHWRSVPAPLVEHISMVRNGFDSLLNLPTVASTSAEAVSSCFNNSRSCFSNCRTCLNNCRDCFGNC